MALFDSEDEIASEHKGGFGGRREPFRTFLQRAGPAITEGRPDALTGATDAGPHAGRAVARKLGQVLNCRTVNARRWALLVSSFLFASAQATVSVPPGALAGDAIEVRAVEVPVVVRGRDDRPVFGLRRDDFELRVDGKQVAIDYFAAPVAPEVPGGERDDAGESTPPEPAPAGGPSAAADRGLRLVVFVDETFLRPGELQDVLPALAGFLRGSLPADAQVLVAGGRDRLEVLGGWNGPEAAAAAMESGEWSAGGPEESLGDRGRGAVGARFARFGRGHRTRRKGGRRFSSADSRADEGCGRGTSQPRGAGVRGLEDTG